MRKWYFSYNIKSCKKKFSDMGYSSYFNETNLSTIKKNDLVNIEIDILSKYVRNYFNAKK